MIIKRSSSITKPLLGLGKLSLFSTLILLSGCASKYEYKPYDPALDQRLVALEKALQEQNKPAVEQQQIKEQDERLARIELQLATMNVVLARMLEQAPVSQQNDFIPAESKTTPAVSEQSSAEPEPTMVPEVLEAAKTTLTPPSDEFKFDGWSSGEKSFGAKALKKFDGTTKTGSFDTNREDLVGKPLERRRFLGPTGEIVNLDDWNEDKNVLLIFQRGFSGQVCVACSVYTVSLVKGAEQFADQDTQVFIVYPGDSRSIPAFLEAVKNVDNSIEIPYPILLDVDLGAVKSLKIEGALAKPTAILIDKKGVVRYAYTGSKIDDRPSVPSLITHLEELNGNS